MAESGLAVVLAPGHLLDRDAPAVALGVLQGDEGPRLSSGSRELALRTGVDLEQMLTREGGTGEAGQVHVLPLPGDGVPQVAYFVGLGVAGQTTEAGLRKAGAALVRRATAHERVAVDLGETISPGGLAAFAESAVLASYSFTLRSEPDTDASEPSSGKQPLGKKSSGKKLRTLDLVTQRSTARHSKALDDALVVARAVRLARDLVNTPSLQKTPEWLASQASAACSRAGVSVTVLDEKALADKGFGGILAVGQGSSRPPRLIQLDYAPADSPVSGKTAHVVLVGKGITFDSGGLSIKPTEGMVAMKTDMGGAAAVIATMTALRDLGVQVQVTGLVAAAENLPSGSATRPGDVITHYGGTTVEVLNTDAEGRLVLADALAYAAARLHPTAIVDIATLTGAMPLALGKRTAGLFSTSDRLAQRVTDAAEATGERVWRMPLTEDYRDSLESPVADLTNISRVVSYQGGSITAALFLREFTGGLPWAHLDIAGPGRSDADEVEITKGGTGYGVRTLLRMLAHWR